MSVTPGAILRQKREAAGLLQTEVGNRVGVSQSTVSRWENDEDAPLATQRRALQELFGIDPDSWGTEEDRAAIRASRALRRQLEAKRRRERSAA